MLTSKNLIRHELIGLKIKVLESTNKSQIEMSGEVVDETEKTLLIKTKKGNKRVEKKNSTFMFKLGDKQIKVSGSRIAMKPENRVKIKVKKW
ncbi:MAG: ribonuclease P protein subunit [Candidatus Aenigmarchaeota archaeon]|nr:ribonuclease P protein subunit [Candidatus Aenigmarchaeota archaeon]